MEDVLKGYNELLGRVPMDLVLFRDAIEHGLYFKNKIVLFFICFRV
jgi:hypothetical protein